MFGDYVCVRYQQPHHTPPAGREPTTRRAFVLVRSLHPLAQERSSRPRAGAETVDSVGCPDPCTCASSCIVVVRHGCTVSGCPRRQPRAAFSSQAKWNADSKSNVSSTPCCQVDGVGIREPQRGGPLPQRTHLPLDSCHLRAGETSAAFAGAVTACSHGQGVGVGPASRRG